MNYKINIFLYFYMLNFSDSQFLIAQGSLTEIHRELCEASKAFSSFHEIEIRKGLQRLRNATLNRASKQQQENALVSTRGIFLNQLEKLLLYLCRTKGNVYFLKFITSHLFDPFLRLFSCIFRFFSRYNRYRKKILIFIWGEFLLLV